MVGRTNTILGQPVKMAIVTITGNDASYEVYGYGSGNWNSDEYIDFNNLTFETPVGAEITIKADGACSANTGCKMTFKEELFTGGEWINIITITDTTATISF